MGSDDGGGGAVDVEAAIERRMEVLRSAHDEYVRLSHALTALRPRSDRPRLTELGIVAALRAHGGPASPRELAEALDCDTVSVQNKLNYAVRTSESVRRVSHGLYEYVG